MAQRNGDFDVKITHFDVKITTFRPRGTFGQGPKIRGKPQNVVVLPHFGVLPPSRTLALVQTFGQNEQNGAKWCKIAILSQFGGLFGPGTKEVGVHTNGRVHSSHHWGGYTPPPTLGRTPPLWWVDQITSGEDTSLWWVDQITTKRVSPYPQNGCPHTPQNQNGCPPIPLKTRTGVPYPQNGCPRTHRTGVPVPTERVYCTPNRWILPQLRVFPPKRRYFHQRGCTASHGGVYGQPRCGKPGMCV